MLRIYLAAQHGSRLKYPTAASWRVTRSNLFTQLSSTPRILSSYQAQARFSSASATSTSPEAAKVAEEAKNEIDTDPFCKIGYLYFDSVFPIRLGFWDLRYMLARFEKTSVLDKIKGSLPPDEQVGYNFHVIGAEERMKDGGAFVTFSYRTDPKEQKEETMDLIEERLQKGVKRIYNPSMLFIGRPGVHVVRGKPFREDMNIFPAQRLEVKLEGGDASDEQLWEILRPYGRILTISKEKPGEALVTFSRMRGATSARNCAHGYILKNGARIVLTFKSHFRGKQAWGWISNHPKIVFPVMAFLVGGITYAIFDPIREFMVESKIANTFSLDDYKVYAWLKDKTVALFQDQGDKDTSQDDWWECREAAESIQEWIRERPATFITISGPRGSGKGGLLSKAITKDVQHLVIDCDVIARSAKNDAMLVSALASETGYRPVFGWLNSLNSMIDLAAVGLIGSKAGFATPLDAQLKQVLGVVANALVHINEKTQKRLEKEKKKRQEAEKRLPKAGQPISEKAPADAQLEAMSEEGAEQSQTLITGPNSELKSTSKKPFDSLVIVIKQFHHKGIKQSAIHEVLSEWAAELVRNSVAHVVFVSDNPVAMSKELAKALPNLPFQSIVLADADEEKARGYVLNRLKELGKFPAVPAVPLDGVSIDAQAATAPTSLDETMAEWVDKLGGRLTDLESLVQKVSLGQSVEAAVQDIISRTVIELRKNAFGEDSSEAKSLSWDREHAWTVIKSLAEKGEISYYGLLHGAFKGNETPVKALEQAEIISVRHHDGRPSLIKAGRPVLQEAIQRLVKDHVFNDTQTLLSNASTIESSEKSMRTIEAEIRDISEMIQGTPIKVSIGGRSTGAVVDEDPTHPPSQSGGRFGFGSKSGPAPIVVASISATEAAKARTEFLMSKMAELQTKVSKLDAENARIKARLMRYKEM